VERIATVLDRYSVTVASGPLGRSRTRGGVEKLPSGSLRVSVYAGIDPVSNRDPQPGSRVNHTLSDEPGAVSQPTRWVKTPVEVNGGPRSGVAAVEGWRAVVVHRAKSAALGRAHGRG
jgi:hypothetical protein